MPLDADLERFLKGLEENTKANKKLADIVTESNKKMDFLAEQLKVMFEGDPGAKLPPLNVLISQMCFLMGQLNMSLGVIIKILTNAVRVPKLLSMVTEIFRK